MRSLVPSDRPLRILDVGCGTGLNAAQLTGRGHDVFGIDVSPVAIEKLRAQGLSGSVVDIETELLPLPENAFDLVYASEVIEHCVDTARFLRNLRVAFALAAYRADHRRYPAKLGELAPKYLAAVHGDLFSGTALLYRPSEKGYLVYSVGVNGKDEGGRSLDNDPPGDDLPVAMPLPELKQKK